MKPFNLEEAIAGKPLVTRDGRKITEMHYFSKTDYLYPVCFIVEDDFHNILRATCKGRVRPFTETFNDLFMAEETKSVIIRWYNIYTSHFSWVSDCYMSAEQARERTAGEKNWRARLRLTFNPNTNEASVEVEETR